MRYFYWLLLWPLSFFDAEKVHHGMLLLLNKIGKWARLSGARAPLQWITGSYAPEPTVKTLVSAQESTRRNFMGLEFRNPVGLAAGLDKNGIALEGLDFLGFGFVELGTVTPKAQGGNPLPRLFRDYHKKIIFNAMGFNNEGCEALKKNIIEAKKYLSSGLVLGVNVGKNKDTPLESAARDYAFCVESLYQEADYFTLNISSPNTAGLRGLQNFSDLTKILDATLNVIEKKPKPKPFLIKLAPEMNEDLLKELICEVESHYPISGWILTNTLQRKSPFYGSAMETGGVSGLPLIESARTSLLAARSVSKKTLISSGGILNADEAHMRMALGADLVQIYSGLVFEGPFLIGDICRKLPHL